MPRNNSGRDVTARIRVLISTLTRHAAACSASRRGCGGAAECASLRDVP
jgi:hypothetical protein